MLKDGRPTFGNAGLPLKAVALAISSYQFDYVVGWFFIFGVRFHVKLPGRLDFPRYPALSEESFMQILHLTQLLMDEGDAFMARGDEEGCGDGSQYEYHEFISYIYIYV